MRYFDKNVSLDVSSPSPWIIRQLPSPQTEKRFDGAREKGRHDFYDRSALKYEAYLLQITFIESARGPLGDHRQLSANR